MKHLLYKRISVIAAALIVIFAVSASVSSAVGRCAATYHFVRTPKDAPYTVTACTKLTWKTVIYGFVPDTASQQPLFTTTAPKQKAAVELAVITVEADSLESAVNKYFGGAVPATVTYTADTKYFSGGAVAIDAATTSTTASLQALGDNLPGSNNTNTSEDTSSNSTSTTTAKALDTTVYAFDNDNNALYILNITAKRQKSAFGRQASKTGQSITAAVKTE